MKSNLSIVPRAKLHALHQRLKVWRIAFAALSMRESNCDRPNLCSDRSHLQNLSQVVKVQLTPSRLCLQSV